MFTVLQDPVALSANTAMFVAFRTLCGFAALRLCGFAALREV
jgi:hypothetical protein